MRVQIKYAERTTTIYFCKEDVPVKEDLQRLTYQVAYSFGYEPIAIKSPEFDNFFSGLEIGVRCAITVGSNSGTGRLFVCWGGG